MGQWVAACCLSLQKSPHFILPIRQSSGKNYMLIKVFVCSSIQPLPMGNHTSHFSSILLNMECGIYFMWCVSVCMCVCEREGDTQTDRERQRQRDTERQKHRERQLSMFLKQDSKCNMLGLTSVSIFFSAYLSERFYLLTHVGVLQAAWCKM